MKWKKYEYNSWVFPPLAGLYYYFVLCFFAFLWFRLLIQVNHLNINLRICLHRVWLSYEHEHEHEYEYEHEHELSVSCKSIWVFDCWLLVAGCWAISSKDHQHVSSHVAEHDHIQLETENKQQTTQNIFIFILLLLLLLLLVEQCYIIAEYEPA